MKFLGDGVFWNSFRYKMVIIYFYKNKKFKDFFIKNKNGNFQNLPL